MPIQASCKCGKQIKVKSEYAGKRIKCPSCSAALQIPADTAGQAHDSVLGDLLDEIGFETVTKETCPECKVNLPAAAVLCIQCGYHLEKRRRITQRRI